MLKFGQRKTERHHINILIILYSLNLGTQSLIPSEISIIIQEEQLAEFTRATIQAQVERLRMFTEVSPSI